MGLDISKIVRYIFLKIWREKSNKKNIIICKDKFIERVSEIKNIFDLFEKIDYIGYPKNIEIQIQVNNSEPIFILDGQKSKNYKEIILNLNNILNSFINAKNKAFREKPLIRYIFSKQLKIFYNYLNKISQNKILSFLSFITNNQIKKEINNFTYNETGNIFTDLFK